MGSLRRRRSEDRPGDDYSKERSIDWRDMAPKWFLLGLLTLSFGLNGALAAIAWSANNAVSDAKFAAVEAKYSDPRWEILSDHAELIGALTGRVKQHDESLAGARQAQEDVAKVREEMRLLRQTVDSINARLARSGI